MKIDSLPNRIAGAIFGFALLLGIGIGASTIAQAQDRNNDGYQDRRDRNWDRYGNYGGSAELRQTALNAGYEEGVKEGTIDRQSNRRANYQSSNVYQRATKDYNRSLGNRDLYRRYFREAFVNGYNTNDQSRFGRDRDSRDDRDRNNSTGQDRRGRNWERYGSYGGSYQLRQTALNAGYNEAIKQGRSDRQKGRYSDFRSFGAFQKATTDYNSQMGDRELYRRYYREGFENGYADGYNGA
jgi:hypothetical protein